MQAADDVEFGGAFANALFGALVDLFKRELIGSGCVRIAAERAKLAVGYANVGGIDVAVGVLIRHPSRFSLPGGVWGPAPRPQIGGGEKNAAGSPPQTFSPARFFS